MKFCRFSCDPSITSNGHKHSKENNSVARKRGTYIHNKDVSVDFTKSLNLDDIVKQNITLSKHILNYRDDFVSVIGLQTPVTKLVRLKFQELKKKTNLNSILDVKN